MKTWWQQDVQLYQQIFFSYHSIKGIKRNVKKESFVGIFFHLQSLISCMGNISKMLLCSEEYRHYLMIDLSAVKIILDRKIRNMNEHIDERLINGLCRYEHASDMSTGHHDLDKTADYCIMRYYNTENHTIQFCDKNGKIYYVKIEDIKSELDYLKKLKPLNYVFCRYSGDDKIL